MKQASDNTNLMDMSRADEFPVGNLIDENVYLVGPNDVLSIQILPSDMVPKMLIVTSQCSIVHPRFGEISLRGLTLKQVHDSLVSIADSKHIGSQVAVTLTKPRKVFVIIRGNVISPGTYTLPASYTVSTAIRFANQMQATVVGNNAEEQSAITRLQESRKEREKIFSETGMSETSEFSSRNIRLMRGNGTAQIVDIERANATKNTAYDPNISEGDEIFVPFEENDYPVVSITGQVLRPATVAYRRGDSASHLLKMGYGLTENADLNNVYLHTNNEPKKLIVDSLGNLLMSDFPLSPGDAIIVGSTNEKYVTHYGTVSVRGEVANPNIYVIEKGVTTLVDIIEKAGGFTDAAYLPLATIGRRDNSQNERVPVRRKYNEYFVHSNMTQQDTMRFNMIIDMKSPRVSCDFTAVFADADTVSKETRIAPLLQDGDVIDIPNKPNKVNVFGQVNSPGYVDFTDGQTMEWYIQKAGGYATNAQKDRARIIRGSNRVWVDGFKDNVYVYDGDEIFVSSPRDVPPEMELQKWAAYAGIAGVVLSLLALLWNIYRDSN
jgi:protein involved in polysaccharide export with SLBB domain